LESGAQWVTIAVLSRVRGNRGELAALPLSSNPDRYQALRRVFLFGSGESYEVESVWIHDGHPIFKFRGVDSISDAEPLRGAEVRVPIEERLALDPGEFFHSDLVGCEVFDTDGRSLGRVTGWEDGGGAGLLQVEGDLLVPFARSICVSIDTAAKRIVVDLPEGLKDLNRS
jgi:16S rRNA processing protein RimM